MSTRENIRLIARALLFSPLSMCVIKIVTLMGATPMFSVFFQLY